MSNILKNVLVIGGSGFMGSHTADVLSEDGNIVSILDKVSSPWLRSDQTMIVGDTMDSDILESSMKDVDCVFHFAKLWLLHCWDYPRSAFEANIRRNV